MDEAKPKSGIKDKDEAVDKAVSAVMNEPAPSPELTLAGKPRKRQYKTNRKKRKYPEQGTKPPSRLTVYKLDVQAKLRGEPANRYYKVMKRMSLGKTATLRYLLNVHDEYLKLKSPEGRQALLFELANELKHYEYEHQEVELVEEEKLVFEDESDEDDDTEEVEDEEIEEDEPEEAEEDGEEDEEDS